MEFEMMPEEKGFCLPKTMLEWDVNNTAKETNALWVQYLLALGNSTETAQMEC